MEVVQPEPLEWEEEQIVNWRMTELVRAGYPDGAAFEVAMRLHIDLHAALDLIRRGCPPETAVRILI